MFLFNPIVTTKNIDMFAVRNCEEITSEKLITKVESMSLSNVYGFVQWDHVMKKSVALLHWLP